MKFKHLAAISIAVEGQTDERIPGAPPGARRFALTRRSRIAVPRIPNRAIIVVAFATSYSCLCIRTVKITVSYTSLYVDGNW